MSLETLFEVDKDAAIKLIKESAEEIILDIIAGDNIDLDDYALDILNDLATCDTCGGSGGGADAFNKCPVCRGKGRTS